MRIYKLTYQIKSITNDAQVVITRTSFAGSKSECAKKRANIRQIHGYIPNSVQTSPLELDTRKNALIKFLNHEII